MLVEPLNAARAKIDRAKQHLEQLKTEMFSDEAANRYGLAFVDDFKTREHIVTYSMPEHLSIRYGILAGEVIGGRIARTVATKPSNLLTLTLEPRFYIVRRSHAIELLYFDTSPAPY